MSPPLRAVGCAWRTPGVLPWRGSRASHPDKRVPRWCGLVARGSRGTGSRGSGGGRRCAPAPSSSSTRARRRIAAVVAARPLALRRTAPESRAALPWRSRNSPRRRERDLADHAAGCFRRTVEEDVVDAHPGVAAQLFPWIAPLFDAEVDRDRMIACIEKAIQGERAYIAVVARTEERQPKP